MQILDFTLAANQARPIEAPGTYLYYYTGSAGGADSTIVVKEDANGTTVYLKPGQALRLPRGSRQAVRWYVQNFANAATIVGTVVIGDGELTDNRITGSVEIIDGGKNRTMSNTAGIVQINQNAGVGFNSHCQIWNPAASGKNIFLEKVTLVSPTGVGTILITTAVANLAVLSGNISSKLNNSFLPTIKAYQENNAAILGSGVYYEYIPAASTPVTHEYREPWCIAPGFGLNFVGVTQNYGVGVTAELFIENV